jgi:hypothetical protein
MLQGRASFTLALKTRFADVSELARAWRIQDLTPLAERRSPAHFPA